MLIRTCEYFILTIKENCQTDNYRKFGKKPLPKTCFYRIMFILYWYLGILVGKLCPGVGILLRFSSRLPELCTVKLSSGQEFWRKNISGPAVSPGGGGMVTSEIDTCIMMWLQKHNTVHITFRREGINENPNNCKYIWTANIDLW